MGNRVCFRPIKSTYSISTRIVSGVLATVFILSQSAYGFVLPLPTDLGRVTDTFAMPAESSELPRVIHIRTVHMNYKVQKKIEKILEHLTRENNVKVIGLEGADVPINPDRAFLVTDPDIRYQVADDLAKEGLVTGAELFAIKAPKDIRILGVEDPNLYQANLSDLRYIASQKDKAQILIDELKHRAERLESVILPREAQQILLHRRKFETQQDGLLQLFHFLDEKAVQFGIEASAEHYPAMAQLFMVEDLSKFIEKSDAQIKADWESYKKLEKLSASEDMESYLILHEIDRLNFPRLGAYKNYLELAEEVNESSYQAVDEGYALEQKIIYSILLKKDETALVEIENDLNDIQHLNELTLLRERVEEVESRLTSLKHEKLLARLEELEKSYNRYTQTTVDAGQAQLFDGIVLRALSFYQLAQERDYAMMRNFVNSLKEGERGVFISGGFHSDGIMKLMRDLNISYSVILPKVEEITEHESYLRSFLPQSAINNKDSLQNAKFEPGLFFGNPWLDPATVAPKRIQSLAGQVSLANQRGFPIELSETQLGPRPEGVEGVTLTSHTGVDGLPVLDVSIRLQDGSEAGIVVDGDHAIVTAPNQIETFDVNALVGSAYERATGFGTQPLPLSGKLSRLSALAVSVLAWLTGCGNVSTNVTVGPDGITHDTHTQLPFGSLDLITTIREFPSANLLGDARQIDTRALTDDKILAQTPYTIGPGVSSGDRGPITPVQNQNGADFITSSQDLSGNFDVSWYAPDNTDDMRDFFNDEGIFVRGHRPEYAGFAFDFSPTPMDTLGDETTPGEADGLILFRRAEAPNAQLPEGVDKFYLVVRETRQPDGTYFIEPVLDQNGRTFFRRTLTEQMKDAGGSSKKVAELIESGKAVPVLRFNVSAEDIRTFGGGKQIRGEVHFADPQRVKIDLSGAPLVNEDGSFVYSHEPFVTGTFEYTEGLGEATVTMVIDPDMFSKLPIRELAIVFTTGPAFLKDVDEDGDGLDDPAGTYPYKLGLGRIKNSVIIAADPSVLDIPYRTSMKTRTGLNIEDATANEQIYADFLAQSIDFAASEAAKSADGKLATVNMKNPNGFGAIPPIRISTIKKGIVHIAAASRDALTSDTAKKIVHALSVAAAAGLSMCGGHGCGTNDAFSVSVEPIDGVTYTFGPIGIPDQQPGAGAVTQNPDINDVEDLLDNQIPEGEIVPVPPQDGIIQPLPVVPARINPEAVVARVPLTSVFGASPVISVSDSNAILLRRGFWDPENPDDSAMRVEWFNPPDLGMSPSVKQPTFVGLAVQGAFGPPDNLPIGTEQTFIQFLTNVAKGLRQDRALQDEASRPMAVIEELAKSYDNMATLLETTTDAELAPVWDLQIALDAEPIPIKVEIKIEGFDAQTGELITIAAAKKTLRGGMVNFVSLELSRDLLKRNMRQLTVVANLGSPTLADGSLNPNYVSKGRMIIIGNQLVLAERDQDGNLNTFPGPSQVPLSEYQPRAIVADNEIRTVTNAFLTNRHNAAFTFPRNAPPIELGEPDTLISLGDLADYFVDLKLSPPPAAEDLANTTPDVQFGGYVDRLDLPFGVAPVETPDGPALPPSLPSVRTLVETFDRLAEVIRNTAAVEFGPGADGESRREAEALKWKSLAQDARDGYRIGVEFVVDAATPAGRPNNVVIPVSLKIEGVDPTDSEASLAPSTSVQTVMPGKTTIIREVLPASVVNNPAINIDQITFVIEAGREFQQDLFGNPLLDEQGNPVPNPLHVEDAQIRIRAIKFFSAEHPVDTGTLESKLMGLATPKGREILKYNPKFVDVLADSLELSSPVRDRIRQFYFKTGGIALYFTKSVKERYTLLRGGVVRTGPLTFADVPLFGILPTIGDIADRLQQEVTAKFGQNARIEEVRFVTPEQLSSASQRPGVRPLQVEGVSFAAVQMSDNKISLAATPEGAAALRAQIATGFGIQNSVANNVTLIRSGISRSAQMRPVNSEVTWPQILGFMSTALGSVVTSGTVGKLFEPRAEGTEQELSMRVVTDLSSETLRQIEFDVRENPNAFYAYLDNGLAPATHESELVHNMTALYPDQFIRLAVPQDQRTSYGAAQYLSDFLTGRTRAHVNHDSEQHLLNQVLNKLPVGKTQADVPAFAFIAASPEIVSAVNELGLDESYKLIMEPQTKRENRIGLGFFGLQVLRMGVGVALKEQLLDPTPDAIRFNTFKPSASVMASLSQIYSAYMQALQAFSVSA